MSGPIQRELKVAFSRNVQPIWFRILKWVLIITTFILFRHQPHFWFRVLGVAVLAVALHLFYRWKTRGWTRAWGGWNDTDPNR